jgi:pimeloyl-ACP methyl ester carboxylesterase
MATQKCYHTKTINDVEVFYREANTLDAPVPLMLHGFPSSSYQFRNVIPQLAKDLRVIAPDLPGFCSTLAPSRGTYD